jgi:ribosomal-protein-serine acetyltransferase
MNRSVAFPARIDTPRLELRGYCPAEVDDIFAMIDRNRELLTQNFAPLAKSLFHAADVANYVRDSADKWNTGKEFTFGIWQKSTAQLVGQIKVKSIVWEVPAAELSYFVDAASQRRGNASEAICAILRSAFDELHFRRICLRIIASNARSLLLAKKLGFRYEGICKNAFRCGFDLVHDVHYYALADSDGRLGVD